MLKKISTAAALFVLAAIFAGTAQAQAGQPGSGKIGWIVTAAFGDETNGITKYVAASKALETEMQPRVNELRTMQTKLQTIADDLKKLQSPGVPVNPQALAAKQDEGEKLQRDIEYKQKDAQAAYQKRREDVLGPITTQIFGAIQEYAKAKGYSVVIDASTLGNPEAPSPILVLDPTANITKDFVVWYNARPATTAAAAKPQ